MEANNTVIQVVAMSVNCGMCGRQADKTLVVVNSSELAI